MVLAVLGHDLSVLAHFSSPYLRIVSDILPVQPRCHCAIASSLRASHNPAPTQRKRVQYMAVCRVGAQPATRRGATGCIFVLNYSIIAFSIENGYCGLQHGWIYLQKQFEFDIRTKNIHPKHIRPLTRSPIRGLLTAYSFLCGCPGGKPFLRVTVCQRERVRTWYWVLACEVT